MAALTFAAAAMPAAAGPLAGVIDSANVNGNNSAAWTFSGGSTGADTVAAAQLAKGVGTGSRLYAFLTRQYTDQAELDATYAALGVMVTVNGGGSFRMVRQAGAAPTATVTTTGATGMVSMRLAASPTL